MPWRAREGGLDEFSPADIEEPQPPEAINFAAVHKQINRRGHDAGQLLRSTLIGASWPMPLEPVPRSDLGDQLPSER
ncbi:MAG: hypothetical protein F4Y47_10205 [Acidobacteriia bacterium]|nr:hypothetical protein [Terriglobia bacterium]